MKDHYIITIAYGLKVRFKNGHFEVPVNKDNIEDKEAYYMDKIVVVPDIISKEEADKLIKEKKAFPYNMQVEVENLVEKYKKENKKIYNDKFKKEFLEINRNFIITDKMFYDNKFLKDLQKLKKRIRIIDEKAFTKEIKQNEKAMDYFKRKLKEQKKIFKSKKKENKKD